MELKYDVVYHVVGVMGRQLELTNESSRIQMVNVQDVKIIYLVDELIQMYYPVLKNHKTGYPSLTVDNDQVTHNMSDPAIKPESS